METTKETVQSLLNQLPDSCSIEDVQYHLYVIEKIKRGQRSIENGETLSHEQVESYY